jgi:hypothetical protein
MPAPHFASALRLERDFLAAALASPTRTATVDDGTDPDQFASSYLSGGKWVGAVVRGLVDDGLIRAVRDHAGRRCVMTSRRKSRHAGTITVWRLTDPVAAAGRIQVRAAQLAALPAGPTQRNLFE